MNCLPASRALPNSVNVTPRRGEVNRRKDAPNPKPRGCGRLRAATFWESVLDEAFAVTGGAVRRPNNRCAFYIDADPLAGQYLAAPAPWPCSRPTTAYAVVRYSQANAEGLYVFPRPAIGGIGKPQGCAVN